jgi:hypothetical protein
LPESASSSAATTPTRPLTAFLASQGTQPAGYHASILIDEVSFTDLRFRQILATGDYAPQPSGPGPVEGSS